MKSLGWELLDAMEKEGCPVCRVVERGLRRFYFWFLNQNYYEGNVIEEMKASYGFCNPLAWLIDGLDEPQYKELYKRSHGLCLEHLLQAIEIGPPEVVKELLEDQAERLTALEWELNEFIRKHNYIYAHEPKGEEQTSWIRAMERLVGSSKRLK